MVCWRNASVNYFYKLMIPGLVSRANLYILFAKFIYNKYFTSALYVYEKLEYPPLSATISII